MEVRGQHISGKRRVFPEQSDLSSRCEPVTVYGVLSRIAALSLCDCVTGRLGDVMETFLEKQAFKPKLNGRAGSRPIIVHPASSYSLHSRTTTFQT
jgi:hypothetical protein